MLMSTWDVPKLTLAEAPGIDTVLSLVASPLPGMRLNCL